MNHATKEIIENNDIEKLYQKIYKIHKPIKAKLDESIFQNIGLVIVKFQRLEYTIQSASGRLSGLGNNREIENSIFIHISFSNLLNIFHSLAYLNNIDNFEELELLIKNARKCEEFRNKIVHSI